MARMEHQRWMRQRLSEGWAPGDVDDPVARTKRCLREWDDAALPEECRASTYAPIDDLPQRLAAAGLQLRPLPGH
jgi:hypothetical protein